MPQQLTHPGVYIEEVPSGVRTIVGVATSITAFAGRAPRGPVDRAVQVGSFTEFVETFGGLWTEAGLAFAVRDFYLNGGSQALIARVFSANSATDDGRTRLEMGTGATAFTLAAATPGRWGNGLRVVLDHTNLDASPEGRFNLTITEADRAERIVAVSLYSDDARRLDRVLERESRLVTLVSAVLAPPADPGDRPRPDPTTDAASEAEQATNDAGTAVTAATSALPGARAKLATATAAVAVAKQNVQAAKVAQTAATTNHDTLAAKIPELTTAKDEAKAELDAAKALEPNDPTKNGKVKRAEARVTATTAALEAGEKAVTEAKKKVTEAGDDVAAAEKEQSDAEPKLDTEKKALDAATATVTTAKAAVDAERAKVDAAFGTGAGNDGQVLVGTPFWDAAQVMLAETDLFNLLCIPPYQPDGADVEPAVFDAAAAFCRNRRAMLLVDPPSSWTTAGEAKDGFRAEPDEVGGRSVGTNAALFFPRLRQPNPLLGGAVQEFAPCGAVAGIFARTDATRGVWKAPAGLDASLVGVPDLSVPLNDAGNGLCNPLGINCLRSFPVVGRVVWGSRTLVGADVLASEWKYVPVRRLALFIEESLFRGTQFVVFEPNDEPLWAQVRLNVGAFMQDLFRQGAFAGVSPREAFVVRCDRETTTPLDQERGIVNIVVGFAPLRPAEFVVIRLQQLAGQTQT